MKSVMRLPGLLMFAFVCLQSSQIMAADIRVAAASNFLLPLKYIANVYRQETGDNIIISAGSTGKLYAQIVNGAPFEIFLAANDREPERLVKEGYAFDHSRFTYARGKLVLWDPRGKYQQNDIQDVLKNADYQRLSLANPLTAPYGAAAMSLIQHFKLEQVVEGKVLRGENISQAYQFVASGAADLGFIAFSQLKASDKLPGRIWLVDENLHEPILQQAVLLKTAGEKLPPRKFLNFLKSSKGQALIEHFGYGIL